eukprot:PLAT14798.1.p1 GENE.PLAT14798.1~~PLAT14798.1.p1  ORF type:complete len:356 (+),score=132.20 PLAT14798.1:51-1118(+)
MDLAKLEARNAELEARSESAVRSAGAMLREGEEYMRRMEESSSAGSRPHREASSIPSPMPSRSSSRASSRAGSSRRREMRDEDLFRDPPAKASTARRSGSAGRKRPGSGRKRASRRRASGASGGGGGAVSPIEALAGEEDSTDGLSAEAAARAAGARASALSTALEDARSKQAALERRLKEASSTLTAALDENKKLQRGNRKLESSLVRAKKAAAEASERADALERQMASMRKEMDSSSRLARAAEAEGSKKDVRLNRALEEVERLKARLRDMRTSSKDSGASDAAMSQLAADNRRLERQKTELLAAFRKQLKLIDILKRQKLHIEAAKLLSFTEEEFSRTLELGMAGAAPSGRS